MTGTNHGMTGAAIALAVNEPVLAIPLSFASHFACDAIPHFDAAVRFPVFQKTFNRLLLLDFLIAVSMMIVLALLFPAQKWLIWACMIAAASPDLMWAYYYGYVEAIKKRPRKLGLLARFHTWVQWKTGISLIFVELIWFGLMWGLILFVI